jgi:peptidoglycan/LPS O-acetylase OafA/YrhL
VSYITPDGVVLDWNQVALCFVLVLALSAFLTQGIEMISRTVSRRRDLHGRAPSKPRRYLVGPTTK